MRNSVNKQRRHASFLHELSHKLSHKLIFFSIFRVATGAHVGSHTLIFQPILEMYKKNSVNRQFD